MPTTSIDQAHPQRPGLLARVVMAVARRRGAPEPRGPEPAWVEIDHLADEEGGPIVTGRSAAGEITRRQFERGAAGRGAARRFAVDLADGLGVAMIAEFRRPGRPDWLQAWIARDLAESQS